MTEENTSENPINDILAPLSNETRRKILIYIGENEPITYSEILEETKLESGSFYWHTSKMTHLITQNQQKHYVLTPKGKLAFKLLTQKGPLEEDTEPTGLEVFIENLGQAIFQTKTWRLAFEVTLLYILWGMILSTSTAIQVFFITEVYTNPPAWLPWASPILSAFSLVFATNTSMWLLQASKLIPVSRDPQHKNNKRQQTQKRILNYSLQTLFAYSAFLVNGIMMHAFLPVQAVWKNILTGLTGFIAMIMFLVLYTAATVYSFKARLKDVLLLILVTSYVLFMISYYLVGVIPF